MVIGFGIKLYLKQKRFANTNSKDYETQNIVWEIMEFAYVCWREWLREWLL